MNTWEGWVATAPLCSPEDLTTHMFYMHVGAGLPGSVRMAPMNIAPDRELGLLSEDTDEARCGIILNQLNCVH